MTPLSPNQLRLWDINWRATVDRNNLALSLGMSGRLNRPALENAIRDLAAHHEVLRTIYPKADGHPEAAAAPQTELRPISQDHLLALVEAPPLEAMRQLRDVENRRFELRREPPFRAHLFELAPTRHILSLVLHRIAADFWSVAPLLDDLAQAYSARLADAAPAWDGLPPRLTRLSSPTDSAATFGVKARPGTAALGRTRVRLNPGLHKRLIAHARGAKQPLHRILAVAFAAALRDQFEPSHITVGSCVPSIDRPPSLIGLAADMQLIDLGEDLAPANPLTTRVLAIDELNLAFTLHARRPHLPAFPGLTTVLTPLTSAFGQWDASVDLFEDYSSDGRPAGVEGIIEYDPEVLDRRRLEEAVQAFIYCLQQAVGIENAAQFSPPYAPPRSSLQHLLVDVWESVMRIGRISMTDSMGELGCSAAERSVILCGMEEVLAAPLPGRVGPEVTLNSLSEALLREVPLTPAVTSIQAGSLGRLPLFFLHGDFSGGGYYTRSLGHLLGPDQPFHVLAPHGLDGSEVPATIGEMALEMIIRLRQFSPEGPYCLAGFCNGGLIALEMAHILNAQGQPVPFLAMIDTPPPEVAENAEHPQVEYPAPPDWKNQPHTRGLWLLTQYIAPIRRYRPSMYQGVLTLLRSEESRATEASGETTPKGWHKFAAQVNEIDIPGTHVSCVSLHLAAVATALRNSMDLIQQNF